MVYIKFGIVFELFVYKIYGDSNRAFLCGTEILNSGLNEMDFSKYTLGLGIGEFEVTIFRFNWDWRKIQDSLVTVHYSWLGQMCKILVTHGTVGYRRLFNSIAVLLCCSSYYPPKVLQYTLFCSSRIRKLLNMYAKFCNTYICRFVQTNVQNE